MSSSRCVCGLRVYNLQRQTRFRMSSIYSTNMQPASQRVLPETDCSPELEKLGIAGIPLKLVGSIPDFEVDKAIVERG